MMHASVRFSKLDDARRFGGVKAIRIHFIREDLYCYYYTELYSNSLYIHCTLLAFIAWFFNICPTRGTIRSPTETRWQGAAALGEFPRTNSRCSKKNLNASRHSEHPPVRGGKKNTKKYSFAFSPPRRCCCILSNIPEHLTSGKE